jgi:hypothetical protein
VYHSPDRSFRIETPKRFRYAKDAEYKWLDFYSNEPESETCRERYAVLVGKFGSNDRPDDPSGMFLIIGGSHIWPSSEVNITVDGFKGKDFVYTDPFESGCKYRRGWIIDTGTLVFWVIYGGDRLEGLKSPRTMRFFKSFHPRQLTSKRTSNKSLEPRAALFASRVIPRSCSVAPWPGQLRRWVASIEIVNDRISRLVCVAIGSIGAIGQAIWIRHDLVDTYPYKMMGPLSDLYDQIGNFGGIIAPAVSIAAVFGFLSVKKIFLLAVPVAICPLVFWAVFEVVFWRGPYHGAAMLESRFDHTTGASVHWLFVKTTLTLAGVGLLIGLASGALISLGERWLRGSPATNEAR